MSINSDDPTTQITVGTKVIHKGTKLGTVVAFHSFPQGPPMVYVQFDNGTQILAELYDIQNALDKREG